MLPAIGMVNDLGHFVLISVIHLISILQIKNTQLLKFECFMKDYKVIWKKINILNHF